ncbi:MAG TPA: kelch repeat-containing protein, partial [Acidobacteriota bacterium]|nr:kelch repeat-containing protein [Acidobacteriota bacterium]
TNGRTSAVPAGATCQARPGFGPGTPYFSSASEQLQQALVQFDFENGGSAALETVLTQASEHDSLTLFHLLKRVAAPDRERFFDRLATLVPLPQGVTREGILRLDPTMIQQWAHRLEEVSVAGNSKPPAVAPGSIYMTGPMEYARFAHTATLLPNGKVLVAGGLELEGNHQALDRAEVYDPATGTFTETGRMLSPRSGHSATLLPDGTVLIVGGATTQNSDDSTPTTEIYDSQTQTFRRAGSLHTARTGHTATLLENGNVLIAGGMGQNSTFPWLDSAEVYDPHTSTFTELNRMNRPRVDHSATLLTDGRVLVAGGFSGSGTDHPITASAEIFDPSRGTFHLTGKMNAERFKHSAVLLHDGSVFFAGGVDARQGRGVVATAERFDPVTEHFQVIGTLSVPRYKIHHSSVLLSSGKVLIAGGSWGVELFDPVTHSFGTVAGRMNVSRYYATATLLQNGSVLIVGGYSSIAHQAILGNASAWIFQEQPKSQKAK